MVTRTRLNVTLNAPCLLYLILVTFFFRILIITELLSAYIQTDTFLHLQALRSNLADVNTMSIKANLAINPTYFLFDAGQPPSSAVLLS